MRKIEVRDPKVGNIGEFGKLVKRIEMGDPKRRDKSGNR